MMKKYDRIPIIIRKLEPWSQREDSGSKLLALVERRVNRYIVRTMLRK